MLGQVTKDLRLGVYWVTVTVHSTEESLLTIFRVEPRHPSEASAPGALFLALRLQAECIRVLGLSSACPGSSQALGHDVAKRRGAEGDCLGLALMPLV